MKYFIRHTKSGDAVEVYEGGLNKEAVNVVLTKGYSGGNECHVHVKDEESGKKLAKLLAEILV